MKVSFVTISFWLALFLYSILSVYVVYKQATDGNAIKLEEQEVRHQRMLVGDSEFFNPWQYRMFSTLVVEGFYRSLHGISPSVDHKIAFLVFRFLQNILIFFIADLFFSALKIANPWLRLSGQMILAFCMAHSVFQSDLSFNTYFDILFYLLAGWSILREKYIWIIPITVAAAFNRETSALIPVMLVVPFINVKERSVPAAILKIGVIAGVLFVAVFISVRLFYGYRLSAGIHGMSTVSDFFFFNIKFFRMYPELVGTLSFLPIVVILYLRRLPKILQTWFWVICPAWFLIHFTYTTAVETRLFLVPMAIIFIPAFLLLIEGWYREVNNPVYSKSSE